MQPNNKKIVTPLTPAIAAKMDKLFNAYFVESIPEAQYCYVHFPNYKDFKGFKRGVHLSYTPKPGFDLVNEQDFLQGLETMVETAKDQEVELLIKETAARIKLLNIDTNRKIKLINASISVKREVRRKLKGVAPSKQIADLSILIQALKLLKTILKDQKEAEDSLKDKTKEVVQAASCKSCNGTGWDIDSVVGTPLACSCVSCKADTKALSIYDVFIEVGSREQADRLLQICKDYKLPYWDYSRAFIKHKEYRSFFYFSENKFSIIVLNAALYNRIEGKKEVSEWAFIQMLKDIEK